MRTQQIIFRCDGGRAIGLGHIMRCLSLAEMLRNDFEISFALQETSNEVYTLIEKEGFRYHILPATENFDEDLHSLKQLVAEKSIVVLDGYNFRSEYQKAIRETGCRLVCIDDLHAWHHYADVVINHAGGVSEEEYNCEPYTQLLLGYEYVMLRKEFLEYSKKTNTPLELRKFFISMGAGDTHGNSLKFARALLHWPSTFRIQIMVSTLNPHLEALKKLEEEQSEKINLVYNLNTHELIYALENTDVVICPASTIALETCAIGALLLSGTTALNQQSNLKGLTDYRMAVDLGDLNTLTQEAFLIRLESLHMNPGNSIMLKNQKMHIGAGVRSRFLKAFRDMDMEEGHQPLAVRKARKSDLMLYFEWANDPEVRKNSFNSQPIMLEDHSRWFATNVESIKTVMLVILKGRAAVGQVRFNVEGKSALLNYSIGAEFRGKGLSTPVIKLATESLLNTHPELDLIVAEVKPENIASLRAFEKNDFYRALESSEKIVLHLHRKS